MHTLIAAAAPHARHAAPPQAVINALLALAAAGIIVLVLKAIGKVLSPKKSSRPASPYGTVRK